MSELLDAADRALAHGEHDGLARSLFVEAGAGSGKTTEMVERVVALVLSGVPLRHVAAVTFTEKAAAELRDRVRVKLSGPTPAAHAARVAEALEELDTAAIGTLHSFARRVLSHHPVEVGLPPLLDLSDDVASQIAADRRFDTTQALLLRDPQAAPSIRLALAAGMTLDNLRTVARGLDNNWDLVAERLGHLERPGLPKVRYRPIVDTIDAVLDRQGDCTELDDKLYLKIEALRAVRADLLAAVDDAERLRALGTVGKGGKVGQAGHWPGVDLDALRQELTDLHQEAVDEQARVLDVVVQDLLLRLADRCLADAEARRESGRLEFHDLLVLARRLVRSPEHGASVRDALQRRYSHVLLDEFQDTDPIQVELAVRIAGGAAASQPDWRDVVVPQGALFVVGDPKQSIYRFRRADITTFLRAAKTLGKRLELTTNFRSSDAVLTWLNTVFARLIVEEADTQPAFVPLSLSPLRTPWTREDGPAVVVLGADEHTDGPGADALREREATDVAQLVARALDEKWRVADRHDAWRSRVLRHGDITILVPARTSIGYLEAALDEAGLSYRTEASSLVYSAPEVRELHLVARAADDPTDELAVVGALRSSILGCGDDDLWRWKSGHGSWNVFAPHPDGIDAADPVAQGMAWMRSLANARSSISPSALLDRVLDERQVLEAAVDSPRYRETWRRLRFVVDQARSWSEAEHGSLREYLSWAERQAEDTARVSEAVLPETDSDAVRITTIHASKGLQFPFVVVTGLSSAGNHTGPSVLWPKDAGCEVRLRKGLETLGYADAASAEKVMAHRESVRLLYVACTRAESHLAVSLHRKTHKIAPAVENLTLAEQLATASAGATHEAWSAPDPVLTLVAEAVRRPAPLSRAAWVGKRSAALANAAVRQAESATDIAHGRASSPLPSLVVAGLEKQPRDLELPAWAKGRYGTAVGRAVHGVLQSIDLTTGDGALELAQAQVLAEGVPDELDLVVSLVRSAIDSPLIRRAAAREHWRETYVGTVVDGVLVEGYVDLLFRDDDGLVIVDFKTDAAVTEESLRAYATQLSVYAQAVADAAGEPVKRMTLLFLRPGGAVEQELLLP